MKTKTNLFEVLGFMGMLATILGTLAVLGAAAFAGVSVVQVDGGAVTSRVGAR